MATAVRHVAAQAPCRRLRAATQPHHNALHRWRTALADDRYFQLWDSTCELTSIVNNWILQTAFIFEELDNEDGVHGDGMGGKKGDIEIAESMWTAARRILAAMQMLMMALDVDIDDRDWLGRPNSLQALGTLTKFRMATHYRSGPWLHVPRAT